MVQQYLLKDIKEKDAIRKCQKKGARAKLYSIGDSNCFCVQFSAEGENEKTAQLLSQIHETVTNNYKVVTIESGCSKYFTRRLYPLINEFECLLRKLLYIASAVNKDDTSSKTIANIETMDFGGIFTMLFVDDKFMTEVKNNIKARNKEYFSKDEVIKYLQSTKENTLWDSLLGEESVPTLRKKSKMIRDYRNDVMHSHNITWGEYRLSLNLFKKVNSELEQAIHNNEIREYKDPERESFNQLLHEAIESQRRFQDYMKPIVESYQDFFNRIPTPSIPTIPNPLDGYAGMFNPCSLYDNNVRINPLPSWSSYYPSWLLSNEQTEHNVENDKEKTPHPESEVIKEKKDKDKENR